MPLKLTSIWVLVLLSLSVWAQEASFTAAVNKNNVGVNETFKITFTLSNADGRSFRPPSFANFNVVGGPEQGTTMQIINGNMTRSSNFSYYLQPQQEGTYTIGGATILVNGESMTSNSITIKVSQGSGNGQGKAKTVQDVVAENVFVKLFVDKQSAYQGEQITATFKLYTRLDISNTTLSEAPAFKGFWTQDLDLPPNVTFNPEVYQGVQYNVAVVKKVALFPQVSGQLEIDPMVLETYARVQVEAPSWNNFFGRYQDVEYKFKSNTTTIDVKSLPTAGKTSDFSGFVGNLTMTMSLDKTETETDDPITLSLNFEGTGNMRMLEVPEIDLPKDFEVFDPKTTESISKASTIKGKKGYDFLIIPRRPGTFKLPPLKLQYFDLDKKEYVTLSTEETLLKVTGEPSSAGTGGVSGLNKEEVELIGQDIRYINTGETDLKQKGQFFLGSITFFGMALSPFLLFFIFLAIRRRQESLSGNQALQKRKKATKIASLRLKEAKTHLDDGNKKQFYDATSRALWGYLGDKLNINPSALSRDKVRAVLSEKGVPTELIDRLARVLDDCEMALFAPATLPGGMQEVYNRAKDIIDNLEEYLN